MLRGNRLVFGLTLLVVWFVIVLEVVFLLLWTDPPAIAWVGFAIPLAVALTLSAGGYVLLRQERPSHSLPVEELAPRSERVDRVLVIADEALSTRTFRDEIARRATERPTEVLIVAPSLAGPVRHWTDDEDAARAAARARLDELCSALRGLDVPARAAVGADDPLQAVEDALRTFGASEILVVTHPDDQANWLEAGLVDRIREWYDLPVTHHVVHLEQGSGRAARV
jgi:hypothetical protein